MSIVYGGKGDSSGPQLYIYDAEMSNSVVEKINNRVRTSRMRQTTSSWIK